MDEIVILAAAGRESLAGALQLAHTRPLVVFGTLDRPALAGAKEMLEESGGKIKGRVYFYQHG